ncbi:MAG: hypothetical protein WC511_00355 [Candidatus Pacearchaeota archaeon]
MPKVRLDDYLEEISEELGDAFFSYDSLELEKPQEILPEVVAEEPKKSNENFHKYSVRGKKLKSNEITALLAQGKHPCGYLRNLHMYHGQDGDVYTGLCSLTEFFNPCRFPRILRNPSENNCPIFMASEEKYRNRKEARTPLKLYRRTG